MLQPFKFITVVMKDRTNKGMQENTTGKPNMKPLIMLTDDLRYHPITMDNDGYGVVFDNTNQADHISVGILMESFNKTFAQHKVLIHGIVPMKAKSSAKAGKPVYWDVTNQEATGDKTDNTPYVGRALSSAVSDDDVINVLIG